MKHEVIEALHSTALSRNARFQKLFELYRKHPEALPAFNRSFNAQGFSPVNLQSLEYELKKVYKIKDTEVAEFKSLKEITVVISKEGLTPELTAALVNLDIENANYHTQLLPLANEVAEALKLELTSKKGDDLKAFLQSHRPEVVEKKVNPFTDAPEPVKKGIKLREQYPFLAAEDCPDKFKILVSDFMTAHDNYVATRPEIKEAIEAGASNEDLFELGKKAVENFELNLEIGDELNHYKEHGEILGKHPIFKEEMMQATVDAYSTKELIKNQKNLRSYISRETKVLGGMDDGEQKSALATKVEDWKAELQLIDKRLAETK